MGAFSLENNANANNNSAFGFNALRDVNANSNSAFGSFALRFNQESTIVHLVVTP